MKTLLSDVILHVRREKTEADCKVKMRFWVKTGVKQLILPSYIFFSLIWH